MNKLFKLTNLVNRLIKNKNVVGCRFPSATQTFLCTVADSLLICQVLLNFCTMTLTFLLFQTTYHDTVVCFVYSMTAISNVYVMHSFKKIIKKASAGKLSIKTSGLTSNQSWQRDTKEPGPSQNPNPAQTESVNVVQKVWRWIGGSEETLQKDKVPAFQSKYTPTQLEDQL